MNKLSICLSFWIRDSRYWMPDSLLVELGFRIPVISGIPDSLRFITDSKAHDSRFHKSNFPHSGFPYMGQTLGIGALFSGGSRGGARGGGAPLICRPNGGPKGRKIFFSRTTPLPLYLRVWMTAHTPPPPYLKVWILHCLFAKVLTG